MDDASGLDEVLRGGGLDLAEQAGLARPTGDAGSGQQQDRAVPLRESVVDVAGQARTLSQGARLTLHGGQLRLHGDKISLGRPELGQQAAPLSRFGEDHAVSCRHADRHQGAHDRPEHHRHRAGG